MSIHLSSWVCPTSILAFTYFETAVGTFIYFLYTSSKIAYLGSYTYNTTESVIFIYARTGAGCGNARDMHI